MPAYFISTVLSILPRPINESQTISIKLKRHLGYKHHYQFQNVRPSKVLEAAQYLVRTSEIFKNKGIQVMDTYEIKSIIMKTSGQNLFPKIGDFRKSFNKSECSKSRRS